ncbi:MAG: outer membrane protein transport protein [Acidobacteria bacterium]|nr:outer membrane protein transport protein [Acidobacteriota bacterium]
MHRRMIFVAGALGFLAAGLVAPAAHGAAFGIFEQGSKGMGMAGAFTAQADDPSLLFHNAGGLAFVEEQQFSAGLTWIHVNGTQFTGADPFPGNVREEMKDLDVPPPHAYWVRPLGGNWRFGLGFNSPFGLATEWKDPNTFTGRFISQRAELQAFDINPTLGVQLTPNFGLGFGVIGRFSSVELERNVPTVNPFTGTVVDIAHVQLESGLSNSGVGFNLGLLHKVGSAFSWGLSYRSGIKIDYEGDGRFTQISTGNPVLDAVVASQLPFGRTLDLETSIEFPEMASLGFAFLLTQNLLAEVDINYTGWSSFDALPITFVGIPALSSVVPQNYDDAYNYRLGFNYTTAKGSEWRFGYVFDESPQPDESVGPLLPDADRNAFTVGYGTAGGKVDLAFMYLASNDRETSVNRDNFNGKYKTDAFLVGVTFNF